MAYFFIFLKIILILYYLIALIAVFYMILENRSPVKTISWILVLLLLPIMGGIFYFFIGHNFKKEKLFEGKKILDYRQMSRMVYEQAIDLKVPQSKLPDAIQAKAGIIQLLLGNGRSRLSKKNKIQILTNGEEKYRELIRSLKNAKSHIHLEYYIFEEGEIANTIKEILIDKSQKGVRVRFIYDQVGSWNLSNEYLNQLKDAGVLISVFRPVRFPVLTSKFNYRNHRKIVVVDGKEGFLGGINIADKYLKGDKKLGFWRDTHIKISGDAVNDLQLIFLTDWYFLTNDEISDEDKYFHDSDIADEKYIQVLASGPDTDFKGIMRSFFSAIATAKESIHIVSPYFLPTESVFTALKTAAMSGVDVQLILPGISDSQLVQMSSRSYFEEMLESGIRIFLYEGGFIHAKLLMVDNIISSVGTANMDFRSFEYNLEINAMIYDEETNDQLMHQFENDLEYCREILLEDWVKRSKYQKIKESFARIIAPML